MEQPRVFRCVPFLQDFVTNAKLDLKAIYRRPVLDEWSGEQKTDAQSGVPLWDLTGPLPLRRHQDYVRKGFQYVTLADWKSLNEASTVLRVNGHDPREYVMDRRNGPWSDRFYLESQVIVDAAQHDVLRQLVERHGSEAVEQSRRLSEPTFRLPSQLRGIEPGGTRARVSPETNSETPSSAEASAVATGTTPVSEPPRTRRGAAA